VSIRLTKNDATEVMPARSRSPARSRPVKNASMTSPYRSSEKISVMLMLMPSDRHWAIAGTPSGVAGILM
jgi:hypothetical protein